MTTATLNEDEDRPPRSAKRIFETRPTEDETKEQFTARLSKMLADVRNAKANPSQES